VGKNLRDYARYGSIGIAWVASSIVYAYLGYRGGAWLDDRLTSEPLFTLLGLVGGLGVGLYSLIKELLRIEQTWRREKTDNEER